MNSVLPCPSVISLFPDPKRKIAWNLLTRCHLTLIWNTATVWETSKLVSLGQNLFWASWFALQSVRVAFSFTDRAVVREALSTPENHFPTEDQGHSPVLGASHFFPHQGSTPGGHHLGGKSNLSGANFSAHGEVEKEFLAPKEGGGERDFLRPSYKKTQPVTLKEKKHPGWSEQPDPDIVWVSPFAGTLQWGHLETREGRCHQIGAFLTE